MILAEVKSIYQEHEAPFDPDLPFHVQLTATIGPPNQPGGDCFSFAVCNGLWLQQQAGRDGALWGATYLVVDGFNLEAIRQRLEGLIRRLGDARDWESFCLRLHRYADWEFENYQPYAGPGGHH